MDININLKRIVSRFAKQGRTVTYQELCDTLNQPGYHPRSPKLHREMEDICTVEVKAGRGMPCVVVVRKDTGRPGAGFFRLARELGRRGSDQEILEAEVRRVRGQ